jgi:hypothetical protein
MSFTEFLPTRRPKPTSRPHPTRLRLEQLEDRAVPSVNVVEMEPNNTMVAANAVPLGFDAGEDTAVIVNGGISTPGDRDWFRVELNPGDVIGAALHGKGGLDPTLRLVDSTASSLVFNDNQFNFGGLLPAESPLPRLHDDIPGGNNSSRDSAIYYVINTAGTYFLEVAGAADATTGAYDLELVVARPALEALPVGSKQILLVDFDGATVNAKKGNPPVAGTARLSPLSQFLPDWGLAAADEGPLIDAILAQFQENLSQDVRDFGLNGDYAQTGIPGQFDIEIRNSRDHVDDFGINPLVTRAVIGGTTAEAGFSGGQAGVIDPGNFSTDDQPVVTLSWIREFGFDQIPVASGRTKIELLAMEIGLLAAHEVGHVFGNYHTDASIADPFNGAPNIMDQFRMITRSIGPDGVFGSADDVDVDFGVDSFATTEGFRGIEDTLNVIALGLSTGKGTGDGSSGGSSGSGGGIGYSFAPSDGRVTIAAGFDDLVSVGTFVGIANIMTMSFRAVDDTAKTSGSDYVASTGTLTFAPGETKTITIEPRTARRRPTRCSTSTCSG